MASNAISAQGSTISIGATTGTPQTLTSAVLGFPTIFTKAAHGFANGDALVFSGMTGASAGLFNGVTCVVTNATANTFAIDLDSTGGGITAPGTATPATWTKISNIKTFATPDGKASEIDISNLDSTGKEVLMGLRDGGTIAFEVDWSKTDPGQVAARAAWQATPQPLKPFKILLPDATAFTFSGYVSKAPVTGGVDQALKSSIDVRVSGGITIA